MGSFQHISLLQMDKSVYLPILGQRWRTRRPAGVNRSSGFSEFAL